MYILVIGLSTGVSALEVYCEENVVYDETGVYQTFAEFNRSLEIEELRIQTEHRDSLSFNLRGDSVLRMRLDEVIERGEHQIVFDGVGDCVFGVDSFYRLDVDSNDFEDEDTFFINISERSVIGDIDFRNIGNEDVSIEIDNIDGNITDVEGFEFNFLTDSGWSEEIEDLSPNDIGGFRVYADTRDMKDVGLYEFEITFVSDEIDDDGFTIKGMLNITDGIPPRIRDIQIEHGWLGIDNTIYIDARDNIGVESVRMYLPDEDPYEFTFVEDDEEFVLNHTFMLISKYEMEFCAYDAEENRHCIEHEMSFEPTNFVDTGNITEIQMPSVRRGRYSTHNIFNMTEDIADSVRIRLSDMRVISDDERSVDDLTIRFIDGDGTTIRLRDLDEEVVIEREGEIFMEILSDHTLEAHGYIEFLLPNFMQEVEDIEFSVEFKSYDVPQPFSTDWFGNELVCDVVDSGNLDDSYYDCAVRLDISIDSDNIPLPMTLEDKARQEREHNQTITSIQRERNIYRFITGVIIALVVVVLIATYFMLKIYPTFRFAVNTNDKER